MAFKLGGLNNWFDHYRKQEIELMQAYTEECEIAIINAYRELNLYRVEHIEPIDDFHAHIWTSFRNLESTTFDLDEVYTSIFPALNRRSTFVTVFSMLEKNLYELCKWLYSEFQADKVDIYLKGPGSKLVRMKNYIHDEVQIPLNENLAANWSKLRTLNLLRNEIVHNFGRMENCDNKYLKKLIHEDPEISISKDYNEVEFGNQFFIRLIGFFEQFYSQLQDAIRIKIEKQSKDKS
ncbi:hypothetical protein [Christiangramia aestuarii]|uniref:hypothetical protein n=1 Tax=Christiangramia aestuarii TaxID=1028746 RepID=UPI00139142A7|nr:hypothetical protein [Christiangramia aestuarii]